MLAEILLSLLKHSQQTPHPPPQKPLSLVRLLLHASLPLPLPSVFSLFSLLSTQSTSRRAGSSPCAVLSLLRRGVTCTSVMPHDLRRSSCKHRHSPLRSTDPVQRDPPLEVTCPASWVISVRQKQRGGRIGKGEQRLAERQKMMVESRGQKCGGESSHWGKSSTPS